MPSASTCVQGTKSKHAFIILTLICSQKCPSVENCETACLKDLRPFIFFAADAKIFTVFAIIEHSNVKYCRHQFRVFLLPKSPNQQTHYDASCLHMKPFGFLSLGQITQPSFVPRDLSPSN